MDISIRRNIRWTLINNKTFLKIGLSVESSLLRDKISLNRRNHSRLPLCPGSYLFTSLSKTVSKDAGFSERLIYRHARA